MRTQLITNLADAEPYAAAWNCMSRGVPFRRWEWLSSWWKHYGGGERELMLLFVFHDETLVAVAPWYMETGSARGRVIRMLGDGEVCTDYLSMLRTPEWSDAVGEAIANWLIDAEWDLMHLSGVAASDSATASLAAHLIDEGCKVYRQPGPNCWRIELPNEWDTFLQSQSKSHRKQIRRADKRSLASGAVTHRIVSSLDASFPAAWQALVELHQSRRQSLGQPGCFSSDAFALFLKEAVEKLLPAGAVELHLLETAGGPLAAELHFVGNDVVYAYQAGIDPNATDEEPGRLMNIAVIRRAIEMERRSFDFLRGDEPYKPHWRAEPQPLHEVQVVPARAAAQLRHGMFVAGGTVKQWVKTGMQLTGMK